MAIRIEHDVPLSEITTFRMGGAAKEVATVETESDLKELFAVLPEGRKWFVLGGGSNVVFPDADCETLIVRLDFKEIRTLPSTEETVTLSMGAGASWDSVVAYAVENGLSGIEALSAIPGTAGATPVQNVGAYGAEISEVLVSLRAYDIQKKEFVTFSNADCRFGYRDSIFKHEGKGRYVISEIMLALSTESPNVPQYPGVADYFAERGITRATLADIRNAIIAIRTKKLPDPKDVASVGSFFKNPFVPIQEARALKEAHPALAVFPISETTAKIGAGSLIDGLGFKGRQFGNISVYKNNALVLVNEGGATRRELIEVVATIVTAVQDTYGIRIEPEPEILEL